MANLGNEARMYGWSKHHQVGASRCGQTARLVAGHNCKGNDAVPKKHHVVSQVANMVAAAPLLGAMVLVPIPFLWEMVSKPFGRHLQ
jgi:hypothetical protein